MRQSTLSAQLAAQLTEQIASGVLKPGDRVTERALADQLRVSRSPVRGALALLREKGIVEDAEDGGARIAQSKSTLTVGETIAFDDDEQVYFRIADDRLNGALPERVTESELLRRYPVTRGKLGHILGRMVEEGWIERLPGNGWEFLPTLTSLEAYDDSFRFRLLIEPAAILEPRFQLNRSGLEHVRQQQMWLIDGAIYDVNDVTLFELNTGLHQAIAACSRNTFFIDSLKRIDRLRRLIDYKQMLDRDTAKGRCREHVHMVDLLCQGKRQEASAFMHHHLASLPKLKEQARTGSEKTPKQ
ncbi:DNA-binding GntR family transcriptional regulator [Sphingobium sp. B1D7B]|uniref:GntR family transcriptional regulator n=1 Tax=Sphingobium sp. B1D7B TaxID=2940578 RepID=UPI0022241C31|nr:GntR family transcriptional regulator [Sphingobium sp. B1D7B]MCW2406866.1 DNA-binding GntR family transcriptional regulator [Sphingobium sp. B1D7B]